MLRATFLFSQLFFTEILGRVVTHLEYQTYSKMALKTMKDVIPSVHLDLKVHIITIRWSVSGSAQVWSRSREVVVIDFDILSPQLGS